VVDTSGTPPEAILPKHANPTWSEHERILALDLYLRRGMVSKRDPELVALSSRLRDAELAKTGAVTETFRNPTGVSLKLANFAALDPAHSGAGMQRCSHGDRATWNEYSGDTDALARAADHALADLPATNEPGSQQLFPLERSVNPDFHVTIDSAVRFATRTEAALVERFGSWLSLDPPCGCWFEVVRVHQKGLPSWDDVDVRSQLTPSHRRHFLCSQYRAHSTDMKRPSIMTV